MILLQSATSGSTSNRRRLGGGGGTVILSSSWMVALLRGGASALEYECDMDEKLFAFFVCCVHHNVNRFNATAPTTSLFLLLRFRPSSSAGWVVVECSASCLPGSLLCRINALIFGARIRTLAQHANGGQMQRRNLQNLLRILLVLLLGPLSAGEATFASASTTAAP